MNDELKPKDHAEAVALFRHAQIGALCSRGTLPHGELAAELRALSQRPVLLPGADCTRYYGASTYEAWLYAYRRGGLDALKPQRRSDMGHGRKLNAEQCKLLLDIKRERPEASAALILRTLEEDGRLERRLVRTCTVRRLYAEHGLSATKCRQLTGSERDRRRWEAPRPNVIWHADVCHGPALKVEGRSVPLRIHALLDDHSRYVLALQACSNERESEMLALLVRAWRGHGLSEKLYLDNGPTYVGDALYTACGRLGITLVHARPYDPQARGKMERFWRTMRGQCLSHLGPMSSLHDVQVRLLAWLERHYQVAPHSSLLGKSPLQVYENGVSAEQRDSVSEQQLRDALTVEGRRRIRDDGTLTIAGQLFETEQGFLAGARVSIFRTLAEPTAPPWLEREGKRLVLRAVDPVANSTRQRDTRPRRGIDAIPFDPPGAHLARLLGKKGGGR
jgi:transposase InsO family protein